MEHGEEAFYLRSMARDLTLDLSTNGKSGCYGPRTRDDQRKLRWKALLELEWIICGRRVASIFLLHQRYPGFLPKRTNAFIAHYLMPICLLPSDFKPNPPITSIELMIQPILNRSFMRTRLVIRLPHRSYLLPNLMSRLPEIFLIVSKNRPLLVIAMLIFRSTNIPPLPPRTQ